MSNLFAMGIAMLEAARVATLAEGVVYSRGGQSLTVNPKATPTQRQPTAAELVAGYPQVSARFDFTVAAADLGSFGSPATGDTIVYKGATFEVYEIEGKCFSRCGIGGGDIQIFTREA
jgi:hypothetical protein